jgi:uncharacterized Ntn-hydrolase superfamily protein
MTYSIVARDPATGALGVAVQTCMFAVGSIVPWARAGVGAVATQAFAETSYGLRCLDLIDGGATASEALVGAQAGDPVPALRQIGVVAADGTAAATTGEMCVDHAGHLVGDGFAVQANMMASPEVWPAMADAYLGASGPFPRRLLAALVAAEAAGGDARGVMSAALVVVAGESGEPWEGRLVDLRVDRSDDPLGDLAELLTAADAYGEFGHAVDHLMGGDPSAALTDLDRGLAWLPEEENLLFLQAGARFAAGDVDGGRELVRSLLAARPSLAVIARSYGSKGLMTLPDGVDIDDLLDGGGAGRGGDGR